MEYSDLIIGSSTDSQDRDVLSSVGSFICEPYEYIAKNMGKGFVSELITAFNHWLQVPEKYLKPIIDVVCMLHNTSLIIDDIGDQSYLRAGKPTAHCVYGTAASINSASYACFMALAKLNQLNHPDAVPIFTKQFLALMRGEGLEIFWRSSFRCPSESEYIEMVKLKSSAMFGFPLCLMQLFSANKTDFSELLNNLCLVFQICDDYTNLVNTSYDKSKTYADDLTEGKFSLPIVYAIRTFPHDNQVASILFQHTNDPSIKEQCVRHLAELGALDYTVTTLLSLEKRCYELISTHGGNVYLCKFLEKLGQLYRTPDGQLRKHHPDDLHQTNHLDLI